MNWAAIVWLVLLIFFILAEASTVTVVSIWFAAGALAAMIASYLGANLGLQVVIFVAVSGALLAMLRPMVRKYFTPKLTKTNVDSVIGEQGIVCAEIDNIHACGQVKICGMVWSARSTSGEVIHMDTKIRVDRVEGVKVFVTPVEVSVSK